MEALSWLTLFFHYYFLYDCINPWRGGPSPEELAADDNRHMDAVDPRLVYTIAPWHPRRWTLASLPRKELTVPATSKSALKI